MAPMKAMIFLDVLQTMESCLVLRLEEMPGSRKQIISLEICRLYFRKTICKIGRTALAMGKDGLQKTVFSCIKRMFGEYVYSVKPKNMIQEMMLKASLYNKLISI